MLQAVLDHLPDVLGRPVEFTVLTTYPKQDAAERTDTGIRLVSATPLQLLVVMFPIALIAALLRLFRINLRQLPMSAAANAIIRSDVVLDLAGISFSDGRGLPILAYNTLMSGVPLLLGAQVVKCSQALGPFDERLNRMAASLILPRIVAVCGRGPETMRHLNSIGLSNATETADLAFLMDVDPDSRSRADRLLVDVPEDFIIVSPSSVVDSYCQQTGIDYPAMLIEFVDRVAGSGTAVVLMPHSYRPDASASRMNDGPLCKQIYDSLADRSTVTLIDSSEDPRTLRAMIDRAEYLVTSRFHAMISALATQTPVLVISWSHKYVEVMAEFNLEHFVLAHDDLNLDQVVSAYSHLRESRESVTTLMRERLDSTRDSARRTLDVVTRLVGQSRGSLG